MKKKLTALIATIMVSMNTMGMIPLEGLIYGDVKDLHHYDPLEGIFSYSSSLPVKDGSGVKKLKSFIGLNSQGKNLRYSCQFNKYYKYETTWQEHSARRAVASTLQYLGIDITMNAIAKYAKLFEFSDGEYDNLVNNLVTNYCSPNISILSHKNIKNNFHNRFKNTDKMSFNLPSIKNMAYYTESTKLLSESVETRQREFDLTIKNFRAFCSWGNDVDNYRMMAPYLANPHIMSIVINNLLGRKMSWNEDLETIVFKDDSSTVKVACDNYLCRKADEAKFHELLPRMLGATNLYENFEGLYCGHFRDATYRTKNTIPKIKDWINKQSIDDPYLEVLQFVALYTGYSEILISAENFKDIPKIVNESIVDHWDKWANKKSNQVIFDLLYEESMHIDLVSKIGSDNNKLGELGLQFTFTLGELDRVFEFSDKIHAEVHLKFPTNYLRWLRTKKIEYNNQSRYSDIEYLHKHLAEYISVQLEKKKEMLLLPIWNSKMSTIMADELIAQLDYYQGSKFDQFSNKTVDIPVKFFFGIFALQYIHKKFKEKVHSKALTSLQKGSS